MPLNIRDARRRQRVVAAASRAARGESGIGWADEVTGAMTLLGQSNVSRIIGAMLKAVDLQASNLVGPPFSVSVAGERLERLVGFGPLAGAPLNMTLLSYHGVARIGVHTDPRRSPTPSGCWPTCAPGSMRCCIPTSPDGAARSPRHRAGTRHRGSSCAATAGRRRPDSSVKAAAGPATR